MKQEYTEAELEIIRLEAADVITDSGDGYIPENPNGP